MEHMQLVQVYVETVQGFIMKMASFKIEWSPLEIRFLFTSFEYTN